MKREEGHMLWGLITEHEMEKDGHSAVRAIVILDRLLGSGKKGRLVLRKHFVNLWEGLCKVVAKPVRNKIWVSKSPFLLYLLKFLSRGFLSVSLFYNNFCLLQHHFVVTCCCYTLQHYSWAVFKHFGLPHFSWNRAVKQICSHILFCCSFFLKSLFCSIR